MLKEKTLLITGGTGSFGIAFVKELMKENEVKKIIIYSRDEYKQDLLKKDLIRLFSDQITSKLRFFIGDVRDKDRLQRAFQGVDYVVHAAAMKQVPACEYNPMEAVKTNIHGAQNVIDAALDQGVKKVISLSTDKAVNPINLYGGTKLVSDKLFVSANAYSGEHGTLFSVVRYGNVAGSRGSVIPLFRDLIENGATSLPITHFEMTRFWISLEEGCALVKKALIESKGGEIFISKIPSFRIVDLALAMLPNAQLNDVGIREGEKIHEVMITSDDSRSTYEYDQHYIIYPSTNWWSFAKHFTPGGQAIEKGFEYNSGTNTDWLTLDELRARVERMSR